LNAFIDAATCRIHSDSALIDRDVEHMSKQRDFAVHRRLAHGLQGAVLQDSFPFDLAELGGSKKVSEILHEPCLAVVALFVNAHGFK
jgi:hypothetical protein